MPITKVLDAKTRKEIFGDNWAIRRRWMKVWTIGFACNAEVILGWTIWAGGSAFATEMFMALLGAICSVMFFYVFGAVYDDHSKRKFLSTIAGDEGGDDTSTDANTGDPR